MKPFISFALLLSLAAPALAVAAAWHIPIEKFAPDLKKNPAYLRLNALPGESVFLRPGDEVWNVAQALHWQPKYPNEDSFTAHPERRDWQGDWIVWDVRSRMLVARGSWGDIFLVDQLVNPLLDQPSIRCRFELADSRRPVLKPVEVVAHNNDVARLTSPDGLCVDLRNEGASWDRLAEMSVFVKWPDAKGRYQWDAQSRIRLFEGRKTLIAQYGGCNLIEKYADAGAWKLYLTARLELSDGTPLDQAARLERPGQATDEPWPSKWRVLNQERPVFPLGDGQFIGFFSLQYSGLDPAIKGEEMEAPKELSAWLRGKVLNVSENFKSWETSTTTGNGKAPTCYYDPRNRMLIAIGSKEVMDDLSVFSTGIICHFENNLWITSDPASGGWGVLATPEAWGSLERTIKGANPDLFFSSSAALPGRIITSETKASLLSAGAPAGSFGSSYKATFDQPQVVADYTGPDGSQRQMSITHHHFFAEPEK